MMIYRCLWNLDDVNYTIRSFTTSKGGNGKWPSYIYEDPTDVIGDKRGDSTIQLFIDQPSNWSSVWTTILVTNQCLIIYCLDD